MPEQQVLSADRASLGELNRAIKGLTVFRHVLDDEIGNTFICLIERLSKQQRHDRDDVGAEIYALYSRLFELLAEEAEFYTDRPVGNAWQNHLVDRLLIDDNTFSRKVQRFGLAGIGQSLLTAVKRDFGTLRALYELTPEDLAEAARDRGVRPNEFLGWDEFQSLESAIVDEARYEAKQWLANCVDWAESLELLATHFRRAGTGMFARFRAFRWVRHGSHGQLEGIQFPDPIRLEELVGYEKERQPVIRNTVQFLAGYSANNVLLYGDRGSGKSSTVKALLNAYWPNGLRLIEVPKQALSDLPRVLALLRDRPERFIIFVDDLSFDEHETAYKDLKAILEGGVEARPANVLLYATSNRRRIVQERWSDRSRPGDDIHRQDTMQEKLSLADRFGLTVTFVAPDQDRFLQIVYALAEQRGLAIDQDELRRRAIAWEMGQNGRSGRSARQFVDDLAGELALADHL